MNYQPTDGRLRNVADGNSRVAGGAVRVALTRDGSGSLSRAFDANVGVPRATSSAASIARLSSGAALLARITTDAPLWFVVLTQGSDLLMLASVFRVGQASTAFVGPGGVANDEEDIRVPVPALTVKELHVGCDEDAGTGSYSYTLMKNGSATALTFTLTGSTRKGSIATDITFASGDWLSLRVVASGSAPAAHHNASVKVTY